jgi:hypothetical protein
MDPEKLTVIQLGRIVRLRHTYMKPWLKVESNKNMDTGKLTVLKLGRIVRLRHTDMTTWLRQLWNPTRTLKLGSWQPYNYFG